MSEITFELNDAWGKPHAYRVKEFPVDDQAELHCDVMPILAGPLAVLVGAFADGKAAAKSADAAEGENVDAGEPIGAVGPMDKIKRVIQGINWGGVSEALQMLPRLIKQTSPDGKPGKFYARILAQTERQRFEPTAEGGEVQVWGGLATPEQRNHAYGGGNIQELYQAVMAVIVIHFGPFGRNGSKLWSEVSEKLIGALPVQSNRTSATSTPNGAGSSAS